MKKHILAAFVIFIALAFMPVGFAWAGSNYQYRRPVTITETSGSTLTDYQVVITLDTASLISAEKMNSDCSDIRVYDSDDITPLNFWVEDGTCNSASTKIWVKIPSLPASSTKTIYVMYGNPTATSASNIDAVFEFGDDFNDGTIDTNKWAWVGSPTESNGQLSMSSSASWVRFGAKTQFSTGYSLLIKGKWDYDDTSHMVSMGWDDRSDDGSGAYYQDFVIEAEGLHYRSAMSGVYTKTNRNPTTNWVKREIRRYSTSKTEFWEDGVLKSTHNTGTATNMGAIMWVNTNTVYWDWVAVRKLASSEPTTSVGSEEQNATITITSISITPSTLYTNTDATCDATFSDVADSASLTWYVNGASTQTASCSSCSSISDTLVSSNFVKGDVVKCEVTATKGTTSNITVQTTVANSAPTAPTDIVWNTTDIVWNTPVIERNVTATASGSTDIDGDEITYYYQLYDVNTSTILQAYSTNNTYFVPSSMLGHVLRVYAKAYDGTDYSAEYYEEATVVNISVTINSPQNTTYLTDTVELNYTVSDSTPFNCTVYLDGTNVDKSDQSSYSKQYTISTPGSHNFQVVCDDADGNSFSDIVYFTLRFDVKLSLYDEQTKLPLQGYTRIHNETYVNETWLEKYMPTDGNLTCSGNTDQGFIGDACFIGKEYNYIYVKARDYDADASTNQFVVATYTYPLGVYTKIDKVCGKKDGHTNINTRGKVEIQYTNDDSVVLMDRILSATPLYCNETKFELIALNGYCYVYTDGIYNSTLSRRCENPTLVARVEVFADQGYERSAYVYIYSLRTGGGSITWSDVLGNKWLDGYSDILYAGTFHLKYPMRGLYSTENIIDGKLYLLPASQGVYATVVAKRLNGDLLKRKILTFYRINPTEQLRVFECKTDDAGQCIVFVDPNTRYKIEYYDTKESRELQFAGGQTYTLIFESSDIYIPPTVPSVSCDISKNKTECQISTNILTQFNITVEHYVNFTSSVVCTNSSWLTSGNLTCSYNDITDGAILVTVIYNDNDKWRVAYSGNTFIPQTTFGYVGIYFMLGLVLISGVAAMLNPIAGLVLLVVSAYGGSMLGLVPGSSTTWIFIAGAAGIILWRAVKV